MFVLQGSMITRQNDHGWCLDPTLLCFNPLSSSLSFLFLATRFVSSGWLSWILFSFCLSSLLRLAETPKCHQNTFPAPWPRFIASDVIPFGCSQTFQCYFCSSFVFFLVLCNCTFMQIFVPTLFRFVFFGLLFACARFLFSFYLRREKQRGNRQSGDKINTETRQRKVGRKSNKAIKQTKGSFRRAETQQREKNTCFLFVSSVQSHRCETIRAFFEYSSFFLFSFFLPLHLHHCCVCFCVLLVFSLLPSFAKISDSISAEKTERIRACFTWFSLPPCVLSHLPACFFSLFMLFVQSISSIASLCALSCSFSFVRFCLILRRPEATLPSFFFLSDSFVCLFSQVETADHARLSLQLSYNWQFEGWNLSLSQDHESGLVDRALCPCPSLSSSPSLSFPSSGPSLARWCCKNFCSAWFCGWFV